MKISETYDFDKLANFLEKRKGDVYKEPNDNRNFIEGGIKSIKDRIKDGDKVLDVGCGQGLALDLFAELGVVPIGITLSEEDLAISKGRGHDVKIMDMSFLDFPDEHFDVLWARHSIEHSIFPYFTLSEWYRVMKPGSFAYFEMPGDNTDAKHEGNMNHYSVLGGLMWHALLERVGFKDSENIACIKFNLDGY